MTAPPTMPSSPPLTGLASSSGIASLVARLLSHDDTNSALPPDSLTVLALTYLAIPNLIFFIGWLEPGLALPMIALAALVLRPLLESGRSRRIELPARTLLVLGLAAALWSALGGAGHLVYANPDWIVRDKVLGDLTLGSWPPAYREVSGDFDILRSAFAYFFPAAVVGKLFGLKAVDAALYLWTWVGAFITLTLLPLHKKTGAALLAVVITVLFSGMDILGIILLTGSTPIFPVRMEWWVPFSYSSLSGQLFWAPNHALPLWIGTLLFFRHWAHPRFAQLAVVFVPLTMLWTPFVAMALAPFLAVAVLRWRFHGGRWRDTGVGIPAAIFALVLTYLAIRLFSLGIGGIPAAATIDAVPDVDDRFALKYLLFVLMEFGILTVLMAKHMRHSHGIFWLAVALLCLLPLYRYGPSNDTMLRLSSPCLVILLVLLLDRLNAWSIWVEPGRPSLSAYGLMIAAVLLIGACTPFFEISRALSFRRTPANYSQSLLEQQGGAPAHYIGRLDRPDLKWIFRTPKLVPNSAQRPPLQLESLRHVPATP